MKKLTFLFAMILSVGAYKASAQTVVLDSLKGAWEVEEVYKNNKQEKEAGMIIFENDGVFKSVGSYFGTTTGLYRTDETRSALYIDIDDVTTEWSVSIRNNVLRLKTARSKKRKAPVVVMILTEHGGALTSKQ